MKKGFEANALLGHGFVTVLALVVAGGLNTTADSLDTWVWRNPLPQGNNLNAVAYGNGRFVAVGAYGTIMSSVDGLNWTIQNSGTKQPLLSVAYTNGHFVSVGRNNPTPDIPILISPDGTNWQATNSGAASPPPTVAYGSGQYVTVNGTNIFTSRDGGRWTLGKSGTSSTLSAVLYANGLFVSVGGFGYLGNSVLRHFNDWEGVILTSPDGVSWDIRPTRIDKSLFAITYGNGKFVAVGYSGTILTSSDGVNWTWVNAKAGHLEAITYGSHGFVAVGYGGAIVSSTDGITWTRRNSPTINGLTGVAYGNDSVEAVGTGATILQSGNLAQPSLSDLKISNGSVSFSVSGETGRSYRIQAATDLISPTWIDLGVITNTQPAMPFVDMISARTPNRFYRAVLVP